MLQHDAKESASTKLAVQKAPEPKNVAMNAEPAKMTAKAAEKSAAAPAVESSRHALVSTRLLGMPPSLLSDQESGNDTEQDASDSDASMASESSGRRRNPPRAARHSAQPRHQPSIARQPRHKSSAFKVPAPKSVFKVAAPQSGQPANPTKVPMDLERHMRELPAAVAKREQQLDKDGWPALSESRVPIASDARPRMARARVETTSVLISGVSPQHSAQWHRQMQAQSRSSSPTLTGDKDVKMAAAPETSRAQSPDSDASMAPPSPKLSAPNVPNPSASASLNSDAERLPASASSSESASGSLYQQKNRHRAAPVIPPRQLHNQKRANRRRIIKKQNVQSDGGHSSSGLSLLPASSLSSESKRSPAERVALPKRDQAHEAKAPPANTSFAQWQQNRKDAASAGNMDAEKGLEEFASYLTAEQLAESGPLIEKVPASLTHQFVQVLRPVLQQILACESASPPKRAEADALIKFLLFQMTAMLKSVRGGGERAERRLRLRYRAIEQDIADLLTSCAENRPPVVIVHPNPDQPSQARPDVDPVVSIINRAVRHIQNKYMHKAAKALKQTGVADPSNPAVLDAMRAQHPDRPDLESEVIPELPRNAPPALIDPDDPKNSMIEAWQQEARKGAAAGSSGLNACHFLPLILDLKCRQGIAVIQTRCANGEYEGHMRDLFLAAKGVPIPKNPGYRPIAIGEILFRVTCSMLVRAAKDAIAEKVGSSQYGLGRPSGTEAVPHIVQGSLLNPGGPIAVIHLDGAQAFQTRSRASMLRTLFKQPCLSSLWRMAYFAYAHPTPIFFMNRKGKIAATITSKEGARQGCALGTTLFDLDIAHDLKIAAEVDPAVQVVALHDDVFLIGPPDKLRAVFDAVVTALAKRGTKIQKLKSEFIYFSDEPLSAEVQSWIDSEGFKQSSQATIVAGAVVAKDAACGQSLLEEQIASDFAPFFKRICHAKMPLQSALLLMRSSGQAGIDYQLRTTQPDLMQPGAEMFDKMLLTSLGDRLHINFEQNAKHTIQAQLPLKNGGLGFRSKADLSPMAWFASQAACAQMLKDSLYAEHAGVNSLRQAVLDMINGHVDGIRELHKIRDSLPSSAEQFVEFYTAGREHADGLQAKLTAILTATGMIDVMRDISRADRKRMESLQSPEAHRFLSTFPINVFRLFTDLELEIAVKHRLGLPATDEVMTFCGVCKKEISPEDHHHSLTCVSNTPHGKSHRHDGQTLTKIRHMRANGMVASAQPRRVFSNSNKTPDGMVECNMQTIFWDDVVTNPCTPANLDANRGVEQAERRKQAKYRDELMQQGYQFRAFSMDVFGKLGDEALKFVDEIAAHAEQFGVSTAKQARNDMLDEMSVQLHKSNSRITQRTVNDNRNYRSKQQLVRVVRAAAAGVGEAVQASQS